LETSSVVDTTAIYLTGIMLIVLGSLLAFKTEELLNFKGSIHRFDLHKSMYAPLHFNSCISIIFNPLKAL